MWNQYLNRSGMASVSSPMHFPHNLISWPASLFHTSHFHYGDCAGMIRVGRNAGDNSDSEVFIRQPIFLSTSPHVGSSSTSPYFPRTLFCFSLSFLISFHRCYWRQLIAVKCQKANCWSSLRQHTATLGNQQVSNFQMKLIAFIDFQSTICWNLSVFFAFDNNELKKKTPETVKKIAL